MGRAHPARFQSGSGCAQDGQGQRAKHSARAWPRAAAPNDGVLLDGSLSQKLVAATLQVPLHTTSTRIRGGLLKMRWLILSLLGV